MGSFILENRFAITRINFEDIYFLEQNQRKIFFYHKQGESSVYGRASQLDCKLHDGFFHCSIGMIINLTNIISIGLSEIVFDGGMKLVLSQAYCRRIRNAYRRYMCINNVYIGIKKNDEDQSAVEKDSRNP